MNRLVLYFAALVSLVFCTLAPGCQKATPTVDVDLLFVHEVYPLLQEKCFACHGDDQEEIEGDFDIRSIEGMLAGGESGHPALVPGKPTQSPLYRAVTWQDEDLEMPPKENDRLSADQVELLHKWIEAGAPWPAEDAFTALKEQDWDYADGIQVQTAGGLSDSWTERRYNPDDLWAFQPIEKAVVPWDALEEGIEGHPIDAFVLNALQKHHFAAAPAADKRTLIRRATYNLTGLPPTPEDIEAFVADTSPEAFQKVVDRLLASPRYGEQWGRHWLDVVRYADTNGYANDYERPNAWRYRDYVIRSFNADKPYDQFVVEQIAGDEIDPTNTELLVATGFLRMGPWEHTGMSVDAVTRQLFLDDVTNSVGETFLSLPLRCASCHDHKFDPIPTRDYYNIQSVFAPVQFAERPASYLPEENTDQFEQNKRQLTRRKTHAEAALQQLKDKEEQAARSWFAARGLTYTTAKRWDKVGDAELPPRNIGLTKQDLGYKKLLQKHLQLYSRQMDRYEPLAYSVFNGSRIKNRGSNRRMQMPDNPGDEIQYVRILAGGSVHAPMDTVGPGVLSALLVDEEMHIEPSRDGRRLAFASWLIQPDHPITARSIVNRIWQYHFGKGLAGNPNNFGVMGKKPTHPELLDWLANYFVQHGWSIKQMHRLIMSSQTYQQASHHPDIDAIRLKDPDNHWLSHFTTRRLSAEELRDAMLFVSGELNLEMGGLPAQPEINMEVALQPRHLMGSVSPAYQPARTPAERNRRTIYTYRYRGMPDPMLEVFNRPSADLSCERRTSSTVTPQAFTLMNSQQTQDRALGLALRTFAEVGNQEVDNKSDLVRRAIALAWGRPGTEKEMSQSVAYLNRMKDYHQANPTPEQFYPVEIKRKMFEEMTGEPFEYLERLEVYEDYVADTKMWEVDVSTRSLADFAKVLFNSNEFVYVY